VDGRRVAPASSPGDLPIVQLGRGGGDPKSLNAAVGARPRRLNHCEAAFSNEKALCYFGTSKRTISPKGRDLWRPGGRIARPDEAHSH
jgi:hypothetical protein